MTDTKFRYAVTTINSMGTVILHMHSVAEVRRWSEANGLVLGKPQLHVPVYRVEHVDGSPCTRDELIAIQPEDSDALYEQREIRNREAIAGRPLPGLKATEVPGLYVGAATAAIRKSNLFAPPEQPK